jgi:hypothetical protein
MLGALSALLLQSAPLSKAALSYIGPLFRIEPTIADLPRATQRLEREADTLHLDEARGSAHPKPPPNA